jgi:hypothetical protein
VSKVLSNGREEFGRRAILSGLGASSTGGWRWLRLSEWLGVPGVSGMDVRAEDREESVPDMMIKIQRELS